MPFEFLPHTADVAVHVWASSGGALFSEATRALAAVATDPDAVWPSQRRPVNCEAPDLGLLLHDLLSEAVFAFDAHRWLAADAQVGLSQDAGVWRIAGHFRGEPLDADRHPVRVVVKAVTLHRLSVTCDAGRWDATVVFDI